MERGRRFRDLIQPRVLLPLIMILGVYAVAVVTAIPRNSATFDELILAAAGARGFATGDFDLTRLYHPRLPNYLYGLPVYLAAPEFPEEHGRWVDRTSFPYANALFFEGGRDPQTLLHRIRLVAMGIALLLITTVFVFAFRHFGLFAAILAATMMAFLPDVLAHGGIAYNDIAGGLTIFLAVWGMDRAVTSLSLKDVVVASLLVALALSVKYSALILAPIAGGLMLVEVVRRREEWRRYMIRALALLLGSLPLIYLFLVGVYLGDFTLESFREGFYFNVSHALTGNSLPLWFLGELRSEPVWYFYPVSFLIKTPVTLHILVILGLAGAFLHRSRFRSLLRPPLRGPSVAAVLIGGSLITASLQIGFRHAFLILPLLIVLVAAGVGVLAQRWGRPLQFLIGGIMAVKVVAVLSWYPHFLPYVSEYFPDRDRGYELVTDSSLDWGQGLLALKEFMSEEGIESVHLSYFGSVPPAAYGIRYVPLPSFYSLAPQDPPPEAPRHVVISATNLGGAYIQDSLAHYRAREPIHVVAHTLLVFEVAPGDRIR